MKTQVTGDVRLVIADDHEIFREGLKLMLSRSEDIHVIGEAAHGRELCELVEKLQPEVVLTDIKMPIMDGIAAAKELHSRHPSLGIIGLSMFDEEDLIMEMLEAGAIGYLVKNADKEEVLDAIKAAAWGEHYYCRQTSQKLANMIAKSKFNPYAQKPKVEFNEKETEIIRLICQEFTNKEIAQKLFMSVRTVEGYRLRILERMDAKNSIGLVIYAIQHDLFTPNSA